MVASSSESEKVIRLIGFAIVASVVVSSESIEDSRINVFTLGGHGVPASSSFSRASMDNSMSASERLSRAEKYEPYADECRSSSMDWETVEAAVSYPARLLLMEW